MPKSKMKQLRAANTRFKRENPKLYGKLAYQCSLIAKNMLKG